MTFPIQQKKAAREIIENFDSGSNGVLLKALTQAGKTLAQIATIDTLAKREAKKGKILAVNVFCCTANNALLDQTSESYSLVERMQNVKLRVEQRTIGRKASKLRELRLDITECRARGYTTFNIYDECEVGSGTGGLVDNIQNITGAFPNTLATKWLDYHLFVSATPLTIGSIARRNRIPVVKLETGKAYCGLDFLLKVGAFTDLGSESFVAQENLSSSLHRFEQFSRQNDRPHFVVRIASERATSKRFQAETELLKHVCRKYGLELVFVAGGENGNITEITKRLNKPLPDLIEGRKVVFALKQAASIGTVISPNHRIFAWFEAPTPQNDTFIQRVGRLTGYGKKDNQVHIHGSVDAVHHYLEYWKNDGGPASSRHCGVTKSTSHSIQVIEADEAPKGYKGNELVHGHSSLKTENWGSTTKGKRQNFVLEEELIDGLFDLTKMSMGSGAVSPSGRFLRHNGILGRALVLNGESHSHKNRTNKKTSYRARLIKLVDREFGKGTFVEIERFNRLSSEERGGKFKVIFKAPVNDSFHRAPKETTRWHDSVTIH